MEHELRVDGEGGGEAEGAGVVLAVVGELGHLLRRRLRLRVRVGVRLRLRLRVRVKGQG